MRGHGIDLMDDPLLTSWDDEAVSLAKANLPLSSAAIKNVLDAWSTRPLNPSILAMVVITSLVRGDWIEASLLVKFTGQSSEDSGTDW